MRIAQISPLYESVPPAFYGGTERIVHFLTEELVAMGHDVTLFASGDSRTSARLVPACERALRLGGAKEPVAPHLIGLETAFRRAREFDVIHSHVDLLAYPFVRRHPGAPVIGTLHGRLDLPELRPLYGEYREAAVVSISDSQRAPLPFAHWLGTVYHGLPAGQYPFHPQAGRYLAFLGRISPEKGLESAIDIAVRAGLPLRIAAKVDRDDRRYFEDVIRPRLDHPLIEYVGEISEPQKASFLGNAMALLFPIDWPEPFGLVMIESMACGTPVIARRRGSVPEVMRHGVSGFVFEKDEAAAALVGRIGEIDRAGCRRYFESRFGARRMAEEYLAIYRRVAEQSAERMAGTAGNGRIDGGGHPRQRQVLHHGQLLPRGEAKPGPQAWRDLRGLR